MLIQIEVAYAGSKEKALVIPLSIGAGASVMEAIQLSGILQLKAEEVPGFRNEELPSLQEKNTLADRLGIFGKIVNPNTILTNGDRVEIYRDLIQDPKESRRLKSIIARKAMRTQRSLSKKR